MPDELSEKTYYCYCYLPGYSMLRLASVPDEYADLLTGAPVGDFYASLFHVSPDREDWIFAYWYPLPAQVEVEHHVPLDADGHVALGTFLLIAARDYQYLCKQEGIAFEGLTFTAIKLEPIRGRVSFGATMVDILQGGER